jgi:cyclopropane fatty-acyl-phospholipid synthase-like methyltransferase
MTTTSHENPLHHPRYPRASTYDAEWVFANQMGPNALWLMESLIGVMHLEPGMRVLDLGCGRAMTSIFLAKELGVRVWATDLWIDASANLGRIREAEVDDLVTPIHAEAHQLPFAAQFFDAIVSVDAYQYFGTADLYLGYITSFLRKGGQIGVVAPAVLEEVGADIPPHLEPYWESEFCCFHSPEWWRTHWVKTGKVRVDSADAVEDGWKDWLRFDETTGPLLDGWRKGAAARGVAMHHADQGRLLGFTRIVATREHSSRFRDEAT